MFTPTAQTQSAPGNQIRFRSVFPGTAIDSGLVLREEANHPQACRRLS